MLGYSLLNDIIFKIVFGSDSSVPVLRALFSRSSRTWRTCTAPIGSMTVGMTVS